MRFQKILFHEILFHEMHGKHDVDKASNTLLLIIFVGHIGRQELLEISAD